METGKLGLVSAPVHSSSVAAPTEKKMDIQAPLTAVNIHTVHALPPQPYPQAQPPATTQEPATLHLAMPPLYSKETLPFLTLHIAGGLQSQQQGLSLAAAAHVARPKSAGKHVCPHCGRDCMKPSVLEKHLRCHTGERPYPCTTCGISFKTQSNLYKHKRTQAHARLSSGSEQSSLTSQDSLYSSRDSCTSSLSLDGRNEESGSLEKDVTVPSADLTCPASTAKVHSVQKQGPDTDWAPIRDPVNEQNELTSVAHKTNPNESVEIMKGEEKQKRMDDEKPPPPNRHLPLQRQEATLFSKQWESSVSKRKSQSHESTDSGFSESSDQYPSPGSVLPEHSMDSLTESTTQHLEQPSSLHTPSEPGQSAQEPKDCVSEQQQRTLEEHISKLISENTAVVEDKQLENVRPRKTVLSKQGSIDLPMPYTYKDSFHFDMKIGKAPNVGSYWNRKPGLYRSVPSQHSTTMEHAPLTRSSSLPFSVTLQQPERSSPTSSFQRDYNVTLARRGSSGHINPTGFAIKSGDQQVPTHRPLVRQTAVDCNHATDGLFTNSSVEEASASSLSCDGDSIDICGEPSNRKCRRKKAQKFAYNKWYMYGGGTFKKLYDTEKGDNSVVKARKALTNPEHKVVQGIQKRSSLVHKEILTMTDSTIESTSSSATVCHPCCLPANLPSVTGVDLNQKSSQLHSSCASLKSPLLRNPSLLTLQLSSNGSSVSHNTKSTGRAEAERLINKEKHTDSVSQLCAEQIPSDRKKQKTDDKITCSLGVETNSNPLTSSSVTVSKQDTNLSYINVQTNQKRIQLKGTLFPPCIINANETSVSTSPATSIRSTAKTNFLPKYQLKLPNAADPSPHTLNQSTGTGDPNFTSHTDQTSPSIKISTASEKKCTEPLVPLLVHSHNIKKTNTFSSAQDHRVFPLMDTTLHQSETSATGLHQNVTPNSAEYRKCITIPTTTTSVHEHHARLCTTLTQSSPSKTVVGSVPKQLPRPTVPVMQNIPATPLITTEQNQLFAAAFAGSQDHHLPPSHTHPSPTSLPLNPINRVTAGLNTPIVQCHIPSFDSAQPAAQNVFHVHTADLQICLQIISDEQLALIEPQIERHVNTGGSSLSQRNDREAMDLEVIQSKVQSSVSMESTTQGKNHEKPGNQKEMNQREPSPLHNMESTTKHQHQKAQPKTLIFEHGNLSQSTISAESMPSVCSSLSLHPLKHNHANMITETMRTTGHSISVAMLKGIKSEKSQTSEEEHVLSLSPSAEEHSADRNVSKGGLVSEPLHQHKLCLADMTSLPPSTAAQNNTGSGLLHQGSQHKRISLRPMCNAGEIKSKCKASVYESSSSEYGESPPPPQTGLGQASSAAECRDALPNTVSSQAPVYSNDLVDSRLVNSDIQQSFKLADMGCNRVGPLDHSAPSPDMMLSDSQDILSSSYSEKHLGQFTSVPCSIHVERLKDVTAVLSTVAGLIEGGSLAGCAVQGHGGTPGQPDITDWEPKQSREAGQTHHRCMERQESGGMEEEDENGGMRSIETEEVLGQWGKSESHCRYIHLPDRITPEEEERKAETDSYKNSWPSEQHHQHLSQTHMGMSDFAPRTPLQGPSTSNNPTPPASSHTSLSSPKPGVEMNSFYFSQPWELSITDHHQQTQIVSETINQQSRLVQGQSSFPQIETNHEQTRQPVLNETFSRHDHTTQADAIPLRETSTAGYSSTLTSSSNESHGAPTSSSHPHHVSCSVHTSRAAGGMTQVTNNGLLDNTVQPSNPWTSAYPEHDDSTESEDRATHDHMTLSSNPVRVDITNRYQCLFSAGQLHGYQTPDYLTSGVRAVPSCQVDPGDTSSSDDEGKLIIEL